MFAPNFDYFRAATLADAHDLMAAHPDAKVLAGGHSLIPILKLRLAAPSALIDIGRVDELRGVSASNGLIRIGALTTHAEVAASEDVQSNAAGLAEAAGMIGDPAVRNRGTIGGNVAHADPASDLPQVLSCMGASFHLSSKSGTRSVAAGDFFEGLMTTALAEDEILTGIDVPTDGEGGASAYVKFSHPASRYAVIGAAARVRVSEGICQEASVVLGGVCPAPKQATAVGDALAGQALTSDAIANASALTRDCLPTDEVLGDVYASAGYRKSVAQVWVRRALEAAASRSG